MKVYPISRIEIFINTPDKLNGLFSNQSILSSLDEKFRMLFKQKIDELDLGFDVSIKTEIKRGCLIEVVTIGLIFTGVYNFIKDYEKLRSGITLLVNDLRKGYVRIFRKKENEVDFQNLADGELKADNIEILKDLPPELEKYFGTGHGIHLTRKGEDAVTRITIFKAKIKEEVRNEDFDKSFDDNEIINIPFEDV